jgi:plastocyanin
MKFKSHQSHIPYLSFFILLIPVLIFAAPVTHVIKFGGRKYTPKTLTVNVGDVIEWQGDFSEHTLSLIKAPTGAPVFKNIDKGRSFQYTVKVAGYYYYQCDDHVDEGMDGSFTAH